MSLNNTSDKLMYEIFVKYISNRFMSNELQFHEGS